MVGLSVILETRQLGVTDSTRQVIDKSTVIMINNTTTTTNHHHHHLHRRHSSSSSSKNWQFQTPPSFLDRCFLCGQKLLPGKDIYMYEGDKGFCSEECRCRQIFMDEEQSMLDAGNCSFAAAMNPQTTASPSSPSPSPPPSRHAKPTRNQPRGFAY